MKQTIYLAGPFLGCNYDEIHSWRNVVKLALAEKYILLDPSDRLEKGMSDKEIVEGDLYDIQNSDILLVNHSMPSDGTAMEIFSAWQDGKEIIVITNYHTVSPWIKYHTTKLFRCLNDALDYLTER